LPLPRRLIVRTASALVMAPISLGAAWAGGWWFAGLVALIGFWATVEWNRITHTESPALTIVNAVTLALAILALIEVSGWLGLMFVAAGAALAAAARLVRRQSPAWPVAGLLYLGVAVLTLLWLREQGGFLLVLWLLLVIWASDVGAYLVGSQVGGPKLAPRLSPNKTWSGLLGGGLLAGTAAALAAAFADMPTRGLAYPLPQFLIGFLLAGWSQLGDIVESTIKRRFNVKDSGRLIPGHGGVLDRIDSLVFTAPVVALVFHLIEFGIPRHG
jgi:phosphatidate cytidylyltransferase